MSIPDKAVEAAARAYWQAENPHPSWDELANTDPYRVEVYRRATRVCLEAAEPYLTGSGRYGETVTVDLDEITPDEAAGYAEQIEDTGWFAPESLQDRLAVAEERVRLLTEDLRIARSEVKS